MKNNGISTIAKILTPVIATALLAVLAFFFVQDMKHKDEMAQLRLDHVTEFSKLTNEIALMNLSLAGLKIQIEQMRFNGEGGQGRETTRSDLLDYPIFYVATGLGFLGSW